MPRDDAKKIGQHTERLAGEFAFEIKELEGKALDMRTVIRTKEVMQALDYYGSLEIVYSCTNAIAIKNMMNRRLVSQEGFGRQNAVDVLRQNFPKKVEVDKGTDEIGSVTAEE